MKTIAILICTFSAFLNVRGQQSYVDSMHAYQTEYIASHDVVKGADKKYIQFFAPNPAYRVLARFLPAGDTIISISTANGIDSDYQLIGRLSFQLHGLQQYLYVFRSAELMKVEQFANYLFVPFTDASSGNTSYGGGRYIPLWLTDMRNNEFVLDFNTAYNPYCAYGAGYTCPYPPKENTLSVAVEAGEKQFTKPLQH